MIEYSNLSDMDVFFYYGELGSDLDLEIQSDLVSGLTQPKHSLFYNSGEGAGVNSRENNPESLVMQIGLRLDIVNWIAKRNTEVTDGTSGNPDRRVAVSQNSIDIVSDNTGYNKINVSYIPFKSGKAPSNVSIPLNLNG